MSRGVYKGTFLYLTMHDDCSIGMSFATDLLNPSSLDNPAWGELNYDPDEFTPVRQFTYGEMVYVYEYPLSSLEPKKYGNSKRNVPLICRIHAYGDEVEYNDTIKLTQFKNVYQVDPVAFKHPKNGWQAVELKTQLGLHYFEVSEEILLHFNPRPVSFITRSALLAANNKHLDTIRGVQMFKREVLHRHEIVDSFIDVIFYLMMTNKVSRVMDLQKRLVQASYDMYELPPDDVESRDEIIHPLLSELDTLTPEMEAWKDGFKEQVDIFADEINAERELSQTPPFGMPIINLGSFDLDPDELPPPLRAVFMSGNMSITPDDLRQIFLSALRMGSMTRDDLGNRSVIALIARTLARHGLQGNPNDPTPTPKVDDSQVSSFLDFIEGLNFEGIDDPDEDTDD